MLYNLRQDANRQKGRCMVYSDSSLTCRTYMINRIVEEIMASMQFQICLSLVNLDGSFDMETSFRDLQSIQLL